ncbi:TonB-dependent siderophore receptor [Russula earlei]|uniref:TonB-dependent siderophore receptor n=1 Tax=Russula earlei TaxID=71964 RepID=A0ACC0TWF1_9AGAM|nr:TonB-dependent siderophore receptor [Russula earlei]
MALPPSFAQKAPTGIIKGTVVTSDGKAAASVNITLQGTGRGTIVDKEGHYILHNITPGSYTLVASFTGLNSQSMTIEVKGGGTSEADITLTESYRQLEEVIVVAGKMVNRFAISSSEYPAKMPLNTMENPQVYSTIPQTLIKEQQAADFQSALLNVPGGTPMLNPGYSVFIMLRGFEAYANVRNGVSTGADIFGNLDPVNLERIEVLKGPSGTLFGSCISSYGGVVNRVTKKPYDHFGGELSYTGGGYNISRFTADINTPINADKTALLRINAAAHTEGSFLDAGGQNKWIMAPSFSYKVSDKLTLTLDAEVAYTNAIALMESGQGLGNLTAKKWSQINMPYNSSLSNSGVRNRHGTQNVYMGGEYKLSANWTSSTIYSYSQDRLDEYNLIFIGFNNDSSLSRNIYAARNAQFRSTDLQQNFTGKLHTGSIQHRLLLGVDYYTYTMDYPYGFVTYNSSLDFTKTGTNDLSIGRINDSISKYGMGSLSSEQHVLAAYGSDVINFTKQLSAMVSLRVDHFVSPGADGYHQTALSPKIGVVYQAVKDKVSIFANYMNGFQNENGADFNNKPFKPQYANQWEGGVKTDILKGRLSATLSYYNILVSNLTRADVSHPGFEVQDATQRSQGLEAELVANPVTGFNIVAGYGYNDNAYVKTDAAKLGKRPVESPANTLNVWTSYRWQTGALRNFIIGFGANYVSGMYDYFDANNNVILPAYTVLRATLSYDQPKYNIGFKLNNFTNEHYWNTNGEAQNLETFTGTLSVKF